MQQPPDHAVENDIAELLHAAFRLYGAADKPNRRECMKQLAQAVPGYSEREYTHAWNRVSVLYEYACKLAFRWANENPPGATIESNVVEAIFMDEIAGKCQGFSPEEYAVALTYGFERGIF